MASKLDYLKRYQSAEDAGESRSESKGKKKIRRKKARGMVIVDEDLSAKSAAFSDDSDGDVPVVKLEEPAQPETTPAVRQWKSLAGDDGGSQRHQQCTNSDSSPPHKRRRYDSDKSPPRRKARHDSDESPPRHGKPRGSDVSPPRRRKLHGSDDESPPRRTRHHDSDESPPRRRKRNDSDESPPRQRKRNDSDESPPRRTMRQGSTRDAQRPSSGKQQANKSHRHDSDDDTPASQSQGQSKTRPGLGGRGDDKENMTVFRDKKTGRKLDMALEKKRKREEEDATNAELEKQMEWGKGLVQKKEADSKIDDMLHEMNKPLARYRDDSDLDKMLRDEDREGDPMLAFMKKKKMKGEPSKPERPVWKAAFPPNRYNVRPGYRWDGVDRSNGFEKKYFNMLSSRKATAQEAYQWSVEDM